MELTERKKKVLRSVVDLYIRTAEPVSLFIGFYIFSCMYSCIDRFKCINRNCPHSTETKSAFNSSFAA